MPAPADNFQVASGQSIYFGMAAPASAPAFDSITFTNYADWPTASEAGQVLGVVLHGSGGAAKTSGRQYHAVVSGFMAFAENSVFNFSTAKAYNPASLPGGAYVTVRPIDSWGNWPSGTERESHHKGFLRSDGKFHLIAERRYDAMLDWIDANMTAYNLKKRFLTGGSMGAWGTISYGVRRPTKFAALYPDRPRWRYGYSMGNIAVADWASGHASYSVANSPLLAPEDGGGTLAAYTDMVAYAANVANKMPWVGWCIAKDDGYSQFQDHIDAVAALRAGKRGFAFYWNTDGAGNGHSTGSVMGKITQSYPFGTFEIGKGYPLFTEHSLDKDPAVDAEGGINIGLSFRNVVETAAGWSCEITNVLGACAVKVEPISDVFKTAVAAQLKTIPAANTWVPVSF